MSYDLPNPWFELGSSHITPDDVAWAERVIDEIEAKPHPGYSCCPDCGVREPCDRHCPQACPRCGIRNLDRVFLGPEGHICGECWSDDRHCPRASELPILMRNDLTYGGLAAGRFQLDEADLMSEIEPVPAFLTRDIRADEIEELLELARAEEWPAPPRRMVG